MKKLIGLLFVVGMISSAFVSTKAEKTNRLVVKDGIEFKKSALGEAMAEAKKKGKLIFIDAYTEWCGPCKKMAATSFMDPEVAKVYNSKFINMKIEMEKSADGPLVAQKYKVYAYPTMLYIDGDGNVVKTVVGYQTAEQLIATAKSL
ncbi:MAG: DUF255 domain-containing protein [Crocinitomicaceae bacterium]|nr:MAG: DUF255 domain-containing protein [Crocinitomicaceae bacterium]